MDILFEDPYVIDQQDPLIAEAVHELKCAYSKFNYADTPTLIDAAILSIQAAELKLRSLISFKKVE